MFVRPNVLRTLRRTMIRFLIEHLVRRIWFGQSRLYFILNWLVWDVSFGPNLRQTRSRQHDRKCRLKSSQVKSVYFNHPSQGNSTNYYLILGSPRQGCAFHKSTQVNTSQQINKFPSKRVKNLATPSSIFFSFSIYRRALLSANQWQWSSNRANVPRTCWAKVFGPRI